MYIFSLKGGQFKYDFNKGKPWQYDILLAPFDFAIQKTTAEIDLDKKSIQDNARLYFQDDTRVSDDVKDRFLTKMSFEQVNDSITNEEITNSTSLGTTIIDEIYKIGFVDNVSDNVVSNKNILVSLKNENQVEDIVFSNFLTSNEVSDIIINRLGGRPLNYGGTLVFDALSEVVVPNISYDKIFTDRIIEDAIKNISLTIGKVSKGERIISKGDIVEGKKLAILESLKSESESNVWTESNYTWIVFGYTVLVSLALLMLLLFLRKYRIEIFENNNKVTFIFFNVFLMVLIQTLVIK